VLLPAGFEACGVCDRHPGARAASRDVRADRRPPVFFHAQKTPVPNFFLAGSYTKQDYIDSMEGATLSGRQCAYKILDAAPALDAARSSSKQQAAVPA
jgi:hypothetical protein